MKSLNKIKRSCILGLLAISALGSTGVSTPASAQTQPGSSGQQNVQGTEQNAIAIGEKNRIQQKIKECNAQQQLNSSTLQQNLQSGLQNATAIGEKNHIKQRVDLCCQGPKQESAVLAGQQNLQSGLQNTTAIGEKNRIKQRIDLCSTQLQPGAFVTQENLQNAEQNATTSGEKNRIKQRIKQHNLQQQITP